MFGVANPLAEKQDRCQAGDTRRDVDNSTTRKVEGAHLAEPTDRISALVDRPDPVRQRSVDEGTPQQKEKAVRPEADSFGKGTANQGRRDDREHALIHAVNVDGDLCVGEEIVRLDALEAKQVRIPAEPA